MIACLATSCAALQACTTTRRDAARDAVDQHKAPISISDLAWLAGVWDPADETTNAIEVWASPDRGLMRGFSITPNADSFRFYELLSIESINGTLTYLASPRGRVPATHFPLTEHSSSHAVFENRQHDFPQRIIYHREGDLLHARIEGIVNNQARTAEWIWKKR